MKIEMGKVYKTREGLKVTIYSIDETRPNANVVHGSMGNSVGSWCTNGRFFHSEYTEDLRDIVSEWEEPRKKGEFKVGDRVAIYDFMRTTGSVVNINNKGLLVRKNRYSNSYYYHPKQCRRLIKKGSK